MKITVELLKKNNACKEGIEVFEALYPRGVTYSKAWHKRMLSGPLVEFEWWAVDSEVIPALIDSVGSFGTANAGYGGTATAGDYGAATAGDYGTATAGFEGTATAGFRGTATAGRYGELHIRWFDAKTNRYRTSVAYVGENGILPNTKYQLDTKGNFILAE